MDETTLISMQTGEAEAPANCRALLETGLIDEAVEAALDLLEDAMTASLERDILTREIAPAIEVLEKGSAATRHLCERFCNALRERDSAVRFKAADDALRLLRQELDS